MTPARPPELSIDFETASVVDLRRAGVRIYSQHPSTRVLCMAYAFDNGPVSVWREGQPFPDAVLAHVWAGRRVNAWNASFEIALWNNCLRRQAGLHPTLRTEQVHDTMAAAAYWGLPLDLATASRAARIDTPKDTDGHRLMMQLCKPRAFDPITGATTWWHEADPAKMDRLVQYCATDVEAERALRNAIPDLPGPEREIWLLDRHINDRGVTLDMNLVERLRDLAEQAAARAVSDLASITGGRVKSINAQAAMLAFLREHGYPGGDLRRSTVEERLADPLCDGIERQVLEIRADAARTSAAKLDAMLGVTSARRGKGTVHGMLQHYGASRTGRWSGRLIQMQNLPRGLIKNVDAAVLLIQAGASVDVIEPLFGPIMGVIASCLRACIVAPDGEKLVVADFAQIEARVLPWLSDEQAVLDVFRSGGDVYVQAAAGIFGRTFPAGHQFVKQDVPDHERQIGKVAVLALGFGGGKGAFATMAAGYGITVPEDEAEKIKAAWRAANPNIVQFWWALDSAARTVLSGGGKVTVGRLQVAKWGPHMAIQLPSGRLLVYRHARLAPSTDRPGDMEIVYEGLNQYTRKWETIRTYGGKLAENVTQAVARDLMANAMLEAEAAGLRVVLTVHDELLATAPEADADAALGTLLHIMRDVPPGWAGGLPMGADGWTGDRYRK
jgi:DNA polymerase bacteriophage-type